MVGWSVDGGLVKVRRESDAGSLCSVIKSWGIARRVGVKLIKVLARISQPTLPDNEEAVARPDLRRLQPRFLHRYEHPAVIVIRAGASLRVHVVILGVLCASAQALLCTMLSAIQHAHSLLWQ